MKKLILLSLVLVSSIAYAQTSYTRSPGGTLSLVDGNEHVVTLNNPYKEKGCVYVKVEIISCNAAGVKITADTATPADWTIIQSSASGTSTTIQYCFTQTNPFIPDVKIRIKGTAADVVKFNY